MKKIVFIFLAVMGLLVSCGKNADAFDFEGTVHGYVSCTMSTTSISEMEFGYVVSLTSPDSIGADYTGSDNVVYHNCVILYRTRTRYYEGDEIKGQMYLDDTYSRAYCAYHPNTNLPEAVCYRLD